MANRYASNWGNPLNNGTSFTNGKKTIQSMLDLLQTENFLKGYFREAIASVTAAQNLTGDGYAVFDGTLITAWDTGIVDNKLHTFSDFIIQNYAKVNNLANQRVRTYDNIIFRNIPSVNISQGVITFPNHVYDCLIYRMGTKGVTAIDYMYNNCTIYNQTITFALAGIVNEFVDGIMSTCDISFPVNPLIKYFLFHDSKFKFLGEGSYTYPTGATDALKLQNLKDRMVTAYGGSAGDYLEGCLYSSAAISTIFLDYAKENFYLVPGTDAETMNISGGFVGKYPPGIEYDVATDFNNLVNLDGNGFVTDQTLNATFDTDIKDIGAVRQITSIKNFGTRAIRNGMQINTVLNIGSAISAGAPVLTDGVNYQVKVGSITLDDAGGTTYLAFETFQAVDEGAGAGLGFSTGDGGVCHAVLETIYDRRIDVKVSKTDVTLSTAVLITLLEDGTPEVNLDALGEPTFGNGDTGFVPGSAVPLNTRYFKFYAIIIANGLTARE